MHRSYPAPDMAKVVQAGCVTECQLGLLMTTAMSTGLLLPSTPC
jgi:hypothetical protein